MIANIFVCYLLQIVFTVGLTFLFGFFIAFCNKKFYANLGRYGRTVCYITGAIGTPLHECAHALFCVLFGHKITEIKLFQINSSDGTLGYVKHSYNPKNPYHKIGNFFIGIAPIIVISAVLYLSAYFLLPDFIYEVNNSFKISDFANDFGKVFEELFDVAQSFYLSATSWRWWAFTVLGIFFALHMTLSREDIKGALSGLFLLLALILIVDVILASVSEDLLDVFTQAMLSIGGYLLCIFALTSSVSLFAMLLSASFAKFKKI